MNLFFFLQIPCFLPFCSLQGEFCERKKHPKHSLKLLLSFSVVKPVTYLLSTRQLAWPRSFRTSVSLLPCAPFLALCFLLLVSAWPEAILAHGISERFCLRAFRHQCVTNDNGMGKVSRTWIVLTCTLESSLRPLASICIFKGLIIKFP